MSDHAPNGGMSVAEMPGSRSQQKRSLILHAAMHHFAKHGYEAARVGDMAEHLGIAKGSVFQHFRSKDGLFFEVYKEALRSLPVYLDVPDEVKHAGFFAVVRYRLTRPLEFWEQYQVPYRVVLLGNYGSDLNLKKRISRFVTMEDPLGATALVKLGLERGEVRSDVNPVLLTSFMECMFERMQDYLFTGESERDLFHRAGELHGSREQTIDQFMKILRGAVGTSQAV